MSPALRLVVRTPTGVVLDRQVASIIAEDHDGWFGVRPGRAELVAVLPAGVMSFRDDAGEGFVALAPAVLHHAGDACRVLATEASVARRLEDLPAAARRSSADRRATAARRDDAIGLLVRELQRRLLEVPP